MFKLKSIMSKGKSIKRSEADLKAKFERLGVDEVDYCVSDELEEGNPRLAPLVMFHEIWQGALRKGDTQWIEASLAHFENRKKLTGAAGAMWAEEDDFLQALLAVRASGIDLKHITTIARRAQTNLLYGAAHTLSGAHSDDPLFQDVHWAVFETDERGEPLRKMACLAEYCCLVEPDRDAS